MISTHVLDTARGQPAAGVGVLLERLEAGAGSSELSRTTTDADGRVADLLPGGALVPGLYRLTFDVGAYFERNRTDFFHPSITVVFTVRDATQQHHHVPLLVSPFGYTTYRGS